MKSIAILLSMLLIVLPSWLEKLSKDKTVIFASLSYYNCDFDGDRLGDLSVWDSKNNILYYELSSDRKFYKKKYFKNNLRHDPVFADYDGDGKTDIAFFQIATGQWITYFSNSLSDKPEKMFFGSLGDIPVPSKLDGGSAYNKGIWRPNASAWLIFGLNEEGVKVPKLILEGNYEDSPISGDFDGDGASDLGVWRPDDGNWHIVKSSTKFDFKQGEHIQHGQEWDIPVPNDYDNDGKYDLVFWRPSNYKWYFLYADDNRKHEILFGEKGDIPTSLDLNNDGYPELALWNPEKKSWKILNITTGEKLTYKWNVSENCLPASSIIQRYE
jgi:hypothetical protein